MQNNILNNKQKKILPFIKEFNKDFGLIGGTAIALQIGHRKSIDFDLVSLKEFKNSDIEKKILKQKKIQRVFVNHDGEYTILVDNIRLTFLYYPFKIDFKIDFEDYIKMPDLLSLGAMKAYALGRRAKWKDYVDLYYIFKNFYSIKEINKKAKIIFKKNFNEKLFRTQLSYFKDIDYSEEIDFVSGYEIDDKIIKKELINYSLSRKEMPLTKSKV
jgi:hypothetical protein